MKSTLFVFADESGIQDNAPFCVLAGYIGSPRQWLAFDKRWSRLLEEYGIPAFHAKRFFARDNDGRRVSPFRDWPDYKARQFIEQLTTVIHERHLYPVVGAVDVEAFNALSLGERRYLTGGLYSKAGEWFTHGAPSKPYYLAFQFIIVEAMQRAVEGKTVHFIFNRQNVLQARAVETFQEIVAVSKKGGSLVNVKAGLGGIGFYDKEQELGLQAADLITHGWYSYLTRGETMSDERFDVMNALTRKRIGIRLCNAEGMEKLLSRIPWDIRLKMKEGKL